MNIIIESSYLLIMKILYISALSSKRLINEIYQKSGKNPGFAV